MSPAYHSESMLAAAGRAAPLDSGASIALAMLTGVALAHPGSLDMTPEQAVAICTAFASVAALVRSVIRAIRRRRRSRLPPVALALLASSLTACVPVPRTLPPALSTWAARKAALLSDCVASGHRGQALLGCMGDYAADRGTYACERTAAEATRR
jgi:hypothetical protein